MCIEIVELLFRIAGGQILSAFDRIIYCYRIVMEYYRFTFFISFCPIRESNALIQRVLGPVRSE